MAAVVPAQPRFAAHKSLYAIDPVTGEATKLTAATGWHADADASLLSILVLAHDSGNKHGMVWVWAQLTPPRARAAATLPSLVLAMPSGRARASAAQLLGGGADDPTADTARRLSVRFGRPVFVSLDGPKRSGAQGMLAVAAEQMDELMTLERCLVTELGAL
ncbi:hypothetical protein IWW55_000624 [Coemansia sp. RSA 2706]|nr:hypothetical protein LPJ63_000453 [Coemansia sp. RSA 2711]KAJ2308112.1 hypothetical protein IWW55_000624 [Coemansia sp. RSA 2706]KAJ2315002.1 hypothetical protein IWW54_000577 [Coemansia sp. RSA 2705]KAJ2321810.1 hypothetical protein IWW52_000504 [Coemansia sp. RSA 2704]KAJ2329396.1 hypothetical protein IWW51_000629 [Coemansia sp. RSA 2702]KAJ2368807.1 hypothetical protein H4S01_001375 [Coemansia sp. RSA 2610]KAJ2391963.1 hypothetical protein H4S02_001045 [Coemansia sp. RSA 2611]KAJ273950